jgi:aminoglycoside phosphotransferase family enzyme
MLRRRAPEIIALIKAGHIVEGHGDLRPEHVFLGRPPLVIDCLEFDRRMRLLDPYDEINYLGLECELLGAPGARSVLIDTLDAVLGRHPSPQLLACYSAFRATLRARLCIAHLLDTHPRDPSGWVRKAERYLERAEREAGLTRA